MATIKQYLHRDSFDFHPDGGDFNKSFVELLDYLAEHDPRIQWKITSYSSLAGSWRYRVRHNLRKTAVIHLLHKDIDVWSLTIDWYDEEFVRPFYTALQQMVDDVSLPVWLEEEDPATSEAAAAPVGDGHIARGPRPDKAARERIVKRYLEIQHQVTQSDYAAQQGISERTLRRWIRGRS